MKKRFKIPAILFGGIVALNGAADLLLEAEASYDASQAKAEKIKKVNYAQQQQTQLANHKPSHWKFDSWTDEASGAEARRLFNTSTNTVNLSFPYSGSQNGRLSVRNHPRYGFDAYIKISKGQMLCSGYNGTDKILVRTDNGPVKTYGCTKAADYSSNILFFRNVAGLEQQFKGAKKAWVTVHIYQEGTRTFQFDVEGYDASKL